MGIKGLFPYIRDNAPGAIVETSLKDYMGRRLAVDASMHLYSFLAAIRTGGDATHRGNEGGAAVHLACRYQQVRVLCYLLARDVSSTAAASGLLEALDARGRTPLMVAVEWFWSNPKRALDVVRALLAFGASATFAEREGGRTALHIAAERGVDGAVFDLLHGRGASCDAEDGDGRTAAEVAAAGGHGGAARALRGLARAAKGAGPCAAAVGRAARPGARGRRAEGSRGVVRGRRTSRTRLRRFTCGRCSAGRRVVGRGRRVRDAHRRRHEPTRVSCFEI